MPTDDDKIWQTYTKGVKPTGERSVKKSVSFRKTLSSTGNAGRNKVYPESHLVSFDKTGNGIPDQFSFVSPSEPKRKLSGMTPGGLFTRTVERQIRQGEITLDARIDLHGMTQTQAHAALAKFIAAQVKAGHRKLLIITGKGKGNEGVLRMNLQGWLEQLPQSASIIGLRPAAPRHGGDGAFYVFLKRRKE